MDTNFDPTSEEALDLYRKGLEKLRDDFIAKAKEEGIPVLMGGLRSSHDAIVVDPTPFDHVGPVRHEVTLAVVETLWQDQDNSRPENLRCVHLHLRLGPSNMWLSSIHNWPFDYESDPDESIPGVDLDQAPVAQERILALAVMVADSEGFVALKNKHQRMEFSEDILDKRGEELPDFYIGDVAERASSIFTFHVLPARARALKEAGKQLPEIAKELGITRDRADKALKTITPEFMQEMIAKAREYKPGSV